MAKRKHKLKITARAILLLLVPVFAITGIVIYKSQNDEAETSVSALSRACQNSPECVAAANAEAEATKNAESAASSANAYEAKVADLKVEIASKNAEIADTKAKVSELKTEIAATEAVLNQDREALAELLVGMHFESDSEPVYILAGSESISDLAERQAREEVVKEQISAKAAEIKEAKEKLESDKSEVENLLARQQEDEKALEASKQEQEELVQKYKDDAEAYAEVASAAREAQRAAEKAEQEAHPELYRGTASSYTGANTYPWQADCPGRQDEYTSYWDGHAIGGYVCECVSYAGWKAYEAYGLALAWGNAYSWDDAARAAGYTVDHNPAAGTIGQVDGYPYGHVFWVESVNADGSINVTEYNNYYATYLYSGSSHAGDFGARTVSASEAQMYNYIHLK